MHSDLRCRPGLLACRQFPMHDQKNTFIHPGWPTREEVLPHPPTLYPDSLPHAVFPRMGGDYPTPPLCKTCLTCFPAFPTNTPRCALFVAGMACPLAPNMNPQQPTPLYHQAHFTPHPCGTGPCLLWHLKWRSWRFTVARCSVCRACTTVLSSPILAKRAA